MSAPSAPIVSDRPDARNSTLRFYWNTPLSDGDGSGISSYTLACTAPTPATYSYNAAEGQLYAEISSLTNRTRYFFDIFATNSNGISSPATTYFAKQPGNPPGSPVFSNTVEVVDGVSSIIVHWSSPTNDGGADIYRYGIWMFPSDVNQNILSNLGSLSSKTYTYPNVFNRAINIPNINSNYFLTVAAINDAGWSDFESYNKYIFITPGEINPENYGSISLWLDLSTTPGNYILSNGSSSNISSINDKGYLSLKFNTKHLLGMPFLSTTLNNKTTATLINSAHSFKQSTIISTIKHIFFVARQGLPPQDYNTLFGNPSGGSWVYAGRCNYVPQKTTAQFYVNGSAPYYSSWVTNIGLAPFRRPFLLNINNVDFTPNLNGIGYGDAGTGSNVGWNGDLAEVLCYSNTLTANQISSVNGYLINKWFPSPSNFSPSSINGCMFWIDASKPNGFTMSGSNISTILDFSPSQYTLNRYPSGCTAPLIGSSINSLSTFRIGGGRAIALSGTSTVTNVSHVFWVGRQLSNVGVTFLFGHDSQFFWHGNSGGVGASRFVEGNASANVRGSVSYIYSKNGDYKYATLDSLPIANCNSVFQLTINTAGTANTDFQGIAYDRVFGNEGRGLVNDVAEIICYNTPLTIQQQETIEGYLKKKWGMTPNPISTPTQLSSLQLWLDATDPYGNGTRPAQSTPITTWTDKSGLARNATANTNNNFFISSCISARPSIRLLSGSYFTGSISPTYTPNTCYVFIVYAGEGGSGQYGRIFAAGNASQEDYGSDNYFGILRYGGNANNVGIYRNHQVVNPTYNFQGSASIPNGNLITVAFNGTTLAECRVNGISVSQGNTGTYAAALSLSAYAIGTNVRPAYGGEGYWEGYVSEVLMYSTLNADQVESVEAYLKQKWNL